MAIQPMYFKKKERETLSITDQEVFRRIKNILLNKRNGYKKCTF